MAFYPVHLFYLLFQFFGYNISRDIQNSLDFKNLIYKKAQKAFEGVAEQMGVYNEEDVQALVDEVRYGKEKK